MTKIDNKENFDEIKSLISKEEEEALPIFQKTDFSAQLKVRIEVESKKKFLSPFLLNIPVPVLAIVALLVFAGVIVFLNRPLQLISQNDFRAIKNFLREASSLQNHAKEEGSMLAKPTQPSGLELSILNVLALAHRESGQEAQPKEESILPSNLKRVTPQDFDKNFEILIKEKKLELFLSRFLKRSEEV